MGTARFQIDADLPVTCHRVQDHPVGVRHAEPDGLVRPGVHSRLASRTVAKAQSAGVRVAVVRKARTQEAARSDKPIPVPWNPETRHSVDFIGGQEFHKCLYSLRGQVDARTPNMDVTLAQSGNPKGTVRPVSALGPCRGSQQHVSRGPRRPGRRA